MTTPAASSPPEHAAPALAGWLTARPVPFTPPLSVRRLSGGRSNVTLELRDGAAGHWVARLPPPGALPSAHDVLREYRITHALQGSRVPVAPTVGTDDGAVLGTPFALWQFVNGTVLHSVAAAERLSAPEREAVSRSTFATLAALHRTDPDAVGLGDLGPREGYAERQLRRWSRQWASQSGRVVPEWEAVRDHLSRHFPAAQRLSVVHGDYRLGNLMVGDGQVRAVLDWELCTLGDPLADLGYLANNWTAPGELSWGDTPTQAGGFLELDTLLDSYAAETGLDLSGLPLYRALAHWRLAAILEGVRLRDLAAGRSTPEVDQGWQRSIGEMAQQALVLAESV